MSILWANLIVRFLLELCVLAALGYWGFKTGTGLIGKVGFGVGVPLTAALIWGTFGAPGAAIPLHGLWHLALEAAVFGSAAAALFAAGRPCLAIAFGLVAAVNRILLSILPS